MRHEEFNVAYYTMLQYNSDMLNYTIQNCSTLYVSVVSRNNTAL